MMENIYQHVVNTIAVKRDAEMFQQAHSANVENDRIQ